MGKESKEFGVKMFDALARRYEINGDAIDRDQLKKFWDQITDESFHSRLQTFFDMYNFLTINMSYPFSLVCEYKTNSDH